MKQSKSKKDRKTSAWYQRHANDPHVKRAQREGKRSRAVFKLTEILDSNSIHIKKDAVIVDLGCAPGSWSEELRNYVDSSGKIIGIDLLPLDPIRGVTLIQGDFDSPEGTRSIKTSLGWS